MLHAARRGGLDLALLGRPHRRFSGWYLNLEEPFRRTATGYDTADLELDIWIQPAAQWRFKDEGLLDERVRDGRYAAEQATRSVRWETTSARSSTAASGGGTTGGPTSSPTRRGVRPPCRGVEASRCLGASPDAYRTLD